jgi:hypothetical protein
VGLAGGGDPDNRRMMPWEIDGATLNAHQVALRDAVTALSRIRGENPSSAAAAAPRSERDAGHLGLPHDRLRRDGGRDVVVAINRADAAAA